MSTVHKNTASEIRGIENAVRIENQYGRSPVLLVCEHAGNEIPGCYENLGLASESRFEHIGWDIGAFAVADTLAETIGATLIHQRYSRLLIDCNRPLTSAELIPQVTEDTPIPGNSELSVSERQRRIDLFWKPFQDAVSDCLDWREANEVDTVLVAVHSFSEVYRDEKRPWHVCLAYNRDDRLARILEAELSEHVNDHVIALNKPFRVDDTDDQTIPVFGERREIPHVLLEIRNDLIDGEPGQLFWSEVLSKAIGASVDRVLR